MAVAAGIVLRLTAQIILSLLNLAELRRHADAVPETYAGLMDPQAYARAVRYTEAKGRFAILEHVWDAAVLALVIFTGVLPWAWSAWSAIAGTAAWSGALFIIALLVALALPGLPLEWWAQFRIEERFGFNRSSIALWISDKLKGLVLTLVIGFPLLWLLLSLVAWMGERWWLIGWAVFMGFQLLMIVIYPMVILPWFNKLTPLPEGSLRQRLLAMAERAGFKASTILVMDGSKRSGHSNAFFTGFGRFRRIVLFDTLIEQLAEDELEAVLAHEIGHYKLGHIPRMLAVSAASTFIGFAIIGWVAQSEAFFRAFGFAEPNLPVAFVLVALLGGVVTFWLSPLINALMRRHEYQADAFARKLVGSPEPLSRALRKLTKENLSNLTPHPLFSAFYYSHPTLHEREAALHAADS